MLRLWKVPLTAFAFGAALAGLGLTDTIPSALIWTALLAAGAGDWWVLQRSRTPVSLRQRAIGATAVLAATYVMMIPALVLLVFVAYAI